MDSNTPTLDQLAQQVQLLQKQMNQRVLGLTSSPLSTFPAGFSVPPTSQNPRPQAIVRLSAAPQSINNSASTTVLFDSVEYDPLGMYVAASGFFYIPVTGVYLLVCELNFAFNATGDRVTSVLSTANGTLASDQSPASAGRAQPVVVCRPFFLQQFDTVFFQAFQNSGGALNVQNVAGALPNLNIRTWASVTQLA